MDAVLKTTVSRELKERIERAAKSVGVSVSTMVERLLSSAMRQHKREEDMELRPEVKKRLWAQVEDAKKGKNMSPRFTTVKDAAEWLES